MAKELLKEIGCPLDLAAPLRIKATLGKYPRTLAGLKQQMNEIQSPVAFEFLRAHLGLAHGERVFRVRLQMKSSRAWINILESVKAFFC